MEIEDDPPAAIPEWVVTFGDMMSLLLTFFIMLVSMSEIKKDEQFQAMVESMRRRFGHKMTMETITPGDSQPRKSTYSVLATEGRAKRKDTSKGGVPTPAPVGEEDRVRIVRQGRQTAVGSVIFFDTFSARLSDKGKADLQKLANELRGKPQKIEVRGHTSPEVAARATDHADSMDLAYERCRAVMDYLIAECQIDKKRFRLASVGDSEPMHSSGTPEKMRMNPRVEVFLLDEVGEDPNASTANTSRQNSVSDSLPAETSNG
jgi:chemotaxis protein MotB